MGTYMLDEAKGHIILVLRAQRHWAGMYRTWKGTIARNAKVVDPFDVKETSAMERRSVITSELSRRRYCAWVR